MIKLKENSLLLILGIILSPLLVYAINSVDTGFNVASNETKTIDAHGICKIVINNSANNYFVPTKTAEEWTAFRNYLPPGVSLEECCVSHDHYACFDNDVYWYDSCNNREEPKKEDCLNWTPTGIPCDCYCGENEGWLYCGRLYLNGGCENGECWANSFCSAGGFKTWSVDCGGGWWHCNCPYNSSNYCNNFDGEICYPAGSSFYCDVSPGPKPSPWCPPYCTCDPYE